MRSALTDLGSLLAHWGVEDAPVLISARENIVYSVILPTGARAAFRLHRTGYQSRGAIRSELLWTELLAEGGFPCPKPVRTVSGDLLGVIGDQVATVVSWIDAEPIGANGVALKGTLKAQCALYARVGALIHDLHDQTGRLDVTAFERLSWDADALLGDDPAWGRFWENPALNADEVALLQKGRALAQARLESLALPVTLIHADVLQENILHSDAGLHLIDFDDSGFGYAPYDLGTALIQHAEHPQLEALTRALLEGYGAPELAPEMALFIALRAMASCGWVISRARADDPRQRFYAERALRCTGRLLKS